MSVASGLRNVSVRMAARLGLGGRNLLAATASQIVSRGIGVVQIFILARVLGPDGFGMFSAILAYMGLANTLGSFGIAPLTTRAIASGGANSASRFRALCTLRFAGAILASLVLCLYAREANKAELTAFYVVAIGLIPGAIAGTMAKALQAKEVFVAPAIGAAIGSLVAAGWTIWTATAGYPLAVILGTVFVSNMVMLVLLFFPTRDMGLLSRSGKEESGYLRHAMGEAMKYWALALMGIIYLRIDLIMLESLNRGAEVGHYAGAYQLIEGLGIPRTLLLTVLAPRLARFQAHDIARARQVYRASIRLLIWVGLGLGILGWMLAPLVVRLLFGEGFAPAAGLLRILLVTLAFAHWNSVNGALLATGQNLEEVLPPWFLTTALNVVLNLWWIPIYGAVGAAYATVISAAVLLVFYTRLVRKRLGISFRETLRNAMVPPYDWREIRTQMAGGQIPS